MAEQAGVVVRLLSGFYTVALENRLIECRARGVMRKRGESPLVGDRVICSLNPDGSTGTVHSILPRKNFLVRPAAANIDRIVIVSSVGIPVPNLQVIDRMTAIATDAGIRCIIVFNKSDLGNADPYARIYRNAGFDTVVVSAESGDGISELSRLVSGGISVFTGNTGVGKSSILNRLLPEENIATGEVSEKLGRGRHTTRHVELYRLNADSFVADTPGFSSLSFDGHELIRAADMQYAFPDFEPYIGLCRFPSCSHISESDCGLKLALQRGEIEPSRYQSYVSLYEEVKHVSEWELKKRKNQ